MILTTKRMIAGGRLAANNEYIANTFWIMKSKYMPKQLSKKEFSTIPVETCYKIIDHANTGRLEELAFQKEVKPFEGDKSLWNEYVNSANEKTVLDAYFVEMFKKISPNCWLLQSQDYKYMPVVVEDKTGVIGLIMPIRID